METSCLKNRNVADGFETLIELTYRETTPDTTKKTLTKDKYHNHNENKNNGCC